MREVAEHKDVLVVGAGVSGVGFAYHLQKNCPTKSYAILEGRAAIGGTWDLFRYPGIRSDSTMHVYAYSFKPWQKNKTLADAEEIMKYMNEVVQENQIDKKIKLNHLVENAEWDSGESKWFVDIAVAAPNGTKTRKTLSCNWLQFCSGYFSYKGGYRPDFPGEKEFQGEIIHPQDWERNYTAKGKRFIVIGSGATAITITPNLAKDADHVTMVQRSPSYIASVPQKDWFATLVTTIFPKNLAWSLVRKKNIWEERFTYDHARNKPEKTKDFLLDDARKRLPEGFELEKHFLPNYNPWDERLCLSPNGDFFEAIATGKASVATGHIETFTPKGLRLKSGEEIEADVIIAATGLRMVMAGEATVKVDGSEIDFTNTWGYKNALFSGVPNMSISFGFLAATWTLRIELVALYVCRLLNYMDKQGKTKVLPQLPMSPNEMPTVSMFGNFQSGYLNRAATVVPKQGIEDPWASHDSYKESKKVLRDKKLNDGVLNFS